MYGRDIILIVMLIGAMAIGFIAVLCMIKFLAGNRRWVERRGGKTGSANIPFTPDMSDDEITEKVRDYQRLNSESCADKDEE